MRNAGKLDEDRGPPKKIAASESKKKAGATSGVTSSYLNYSGAVSQFSSSFPSDEKLPDAASEKELVGDVDIWIGRISSFYLFIFEKEDRGHSPACTHAPINDTQVKSLVRQWWLNLEPPPWEGGVLPMG